MNPYQSWGRYPQAQHQVQHMSWSTDPMMWPSKGNTVLPFGKGRSYGDVCSNNGGTLLDTARLNHFMNFDAMTGILRCEAGVTLAEILNAFVPRGCFLPVTPGTKFVTVGGAIANDVHGKNHHRAGTFGRYVRQFELMRSDGCRYLCSPVENKDLFHATIGGLGLTGLILWADIQLQPIASPWMEVEKIPFANIDAFIALAKKSDADYEYTVAWADCLSTGEALGRGIFMRANHAKASDLESRSIQQRPTNRKPVFCVPFDMPGFLLNKYSLRLLNHLYYQHARGNGAPAITHYDPFFYPLDFVLDWNRVYGRRGFLQYQCVIPPEDPSAIKAVLEEITCSGLGSFLAVLKMFGAAQSPGILSFPREGITLALDFPNKGKKVFDLLDRLDAIVREARGAVNPSKDARMAAESFKAFFPRWEEFSAFIDPQFSSSFWRRVTQS